MIEENVIQNIGNNNPELVESPATGAPAETTEPEVAVYQTPGQPDPAADAEPEPPILRHIRPSFWD